MKLIDRYILKELIFPFLSGVLAFTVILVGSTVLFDLLRQAVKYGIPMLDVVLLLLLKLPMVIAISMPMATLFSTITVFGRLDNDLEILALRSNGINVLRLLVPVVIMGLFVSILSLWFSQVVVPISSNSATELFLTFKQQGKFSIQQHINITEYKDNLPYRIINVGEKNGMELKNVTVAEYDNGYLSRLIRAARGQWLPSRGWVFFDGVLHYFNQNDPTQITVLEYEKEFINLDLKPVDLKKRDKSLEEMTRKELLEKIDFFSRTGVDTTKLEMDMHMKVSVAFSSFIYCFLGAAMGLKPHRSSSAMGIGISLIIIFIYIILMAVGSWLGLSGTVSPLLAAWFPNFVIGFFSIMLVRKLASS